MATAEISTIEHSLKMKGHNTTLTEAELEGCGFLTESQAKLQLKGTISPWT